MDKTDIQLQGLYAIIRLNEIFGHLTSNLKDSLSVAVVEISKLFSTDACAILMIEEDRKTLKPASAQLQKDIYQYPDMLKSSDMSRCRAIADKTLVISSRNTCCQNRVYKTMPGLSICIPLIVDNNSIGVLSIDYLDRESLSNEDLNLLIAIGNLISSAIHRINLYTNINNKLTELKNTQAQLVQSQKLEAVGRLAGGIAHDLNNILAAIIGYAELAASPATDKGKIKNHIERILEASGQASSLTKQILAFSRKQAINLEVINPNEVIKNFQPLLKTLLSENIEMEITLSHDACGIEADRQQIEQVIMNLTLNARDAMPKGGRLMIKTEKAEVKESLAVSLNIDRGRYFIITISDRGTGMTEDVLQHIFEPFFTTKEGGKGAGLGLAVAYGIIKQHRGTIDVESHIEKGTAFKIYLPCTEK